MVAISTWSTLSCITKLLPCEVNICSWEVFCILSVCVKMICRIHKKFTGNISECYCLRFISKTPSIKMPGYPNDCNWNGVCDQCEFYLYITTKAFASMHAFSRGFFNPGIFYLWNVLGIRVQLLTCSWYHIQSDDPEVYTVLVSVSVL